MSESNILLSALLFLNRCNGSVTKTLPQRLTLQNKTH